MPSWELYLRHEKLNWFWKGIIVLVHSHKLANDVTKIYFESSVECYTRSGGNSRTINFDLGITWKSWGSKSFLIVSRSNLSGLRKQYSKKCLWSSRFCREVKQTRFRDRSWLHEDRPRHCILFTLVRRRMKMGRVFSSHVADS